MSLPGGLTGGATLPDLQQSPADTQRATIEQTRATAYDTAKQQYETTKSAAQQQYQTEIDAAQERYNQAVEAAKQDVGDDASPGDVEAAQQRREEAIQQARDQLQSDREAAKQTYEQVVQAAQDGYDSATQAADQAAEAATQAADAQETQQQAIDQQSQELQANGGSATLDINKPYVPGTLDTGMSATEGAVPSPTVPPPGATPPGTQRIPQPGEDLDQNGIEDILELYEHVVGQNQPGIVQPDAPSRIVGGQNAFTQPYTPRIPGPPLPGQPDLALGQLQQQPGQTTTDPTARVVETAINTVMDRVGIPQAPRPLPGGTGGGVATPPAPEAPAAPVLPAQPGAPPRPPVLEDAGSQLQQLIQEQMRIDPVWAPQLYGAPPITPAANKEQQDIANAVNAPRAVELPNSPPTAPQAAGVAVTPQGLEQRAQTSTPSLPTPGASSEPGSFLPGGPATGGGAPPLPTVSSPAMGAFNQATAQPAAAPNGSVLFEDSQAGGWVEIPAQGPARLLTFAQAQQAVRAGAVASGPNARNLELRGAQERPDAQAAPYRNAQGQVVAHPVAPIEGEAAGNVMPTMRLQTSEEIAANERSLQPQEVRALVNPTPVPSVKLVDDVPGIRVGDINALPPEARGTAGNVRYAVQVPGTQAAVLNDSNGVLTEQYVNRYANKTYVRDMTSIVGDYAQSIEQQARGKQYGDLSPMAPTQWLGWSMDESTGGWNQHGQTRGFTMNPHSLFATAKNADEMIQHIQTVVSHEQTHSAQNSDADLDTDYVLNGNSDPSHGPRYRAAGAQLDAEMKASPAYQQMVQGVKKFWATHDMNMVKRDNVELSQAIASSRKGLASEEEARVALGTPTTRVAGATDIRTSPEQVDQQQQQGQYPGYGTPALNRSSEWAPRGLAMGREQIDQAQQGYAPTNPNAVTTGAPNAWRFDRDMSNPNYSFTRFVQPQGAEAGKLGTVLDQSLSMYDAQKAGTSRIPLRDIPVEEKAVVADAVGALARGDEAPKWAINPLQNAARAAWQKENGDPGIDPKYADPQYVAKWVNGFLEGKTDQPLQKELSEDIRRVGKAPPEDIAASLKGPSWIGKYGRDLGAGVKVDNETKQLAVPQTQEMAARYGLGVQNTLAVCGPIAANAMLRAANGDDSISLDQVWKKATSGPNPYWNGAWTGPVNYARFLGKEYGKDVGLVTELSYSAGDVGDLSNPRMGVRPSEISQVMAQDVTEGKPVTVSISGTNGHYFVATDYDPAANKFYVGTTGTVYRGGSTWMSLDQMKTTAGGGAIAAIRFNSPLTGERKGEPVKIAVPGEAIKSMDEIDRQSVAAQPAAGGLSRSDEWRGTGTPPVAQSPATPQYAEMAFKPSASEPEIRSLQQRIVSEAPKLPDKPLGSTEETMKAWAPTLQWVETQTGLPAEYMAGIVMAENGFGNSNLSRNYNNYFSLEHNSLDRFSQGAPDGRFASYKTPQDALARFVGMIAHPENSYNTRGSAWQDRKDPDKFIQGLVKGGYIVDEKGFPVKTWVDNNEKGRAMWRRVIGAPRSA